MPKCFWSYNYRLITTAQQHENLLLVVASQVDQLWQHVVTCLPASANYCGSVPQEQRWQADRRLFLACNGSSNFERCIVVVSRMIFYFVSISRFMSDEDRVFMVPSHETKTETETRGFQDQDQDQDSEVPRPRPRLRDSRPRPRPRLVKTGLDKSRDQDSSLENSARPQVSKYSS